MISAKQPDVSHRNLSNLILHNWLHSNQSTVNSIHIKLTCLCLYSETFKPQSQTYVTILVAFCASKLGRRNRDRCFCVFLSCAVVILETGEKKKAKSTDLLNPSFCHTHAKHYQTLQALPLKLKEPFTNCNTATSEWWCLNTNALVIWESARVPGQHSHQIQQCVYTQDLFGKLKVCYSGSLLTTSYLPASTTWC